MPVARVGSGRRKVVTSVAVILALVGLVFLGHATYRNHYLRVNAQRLVQAGASLRVFPHRVNSSAEAQELWRVGVRSFEVDIGYNRSADRFELGHDEGDRAGSLEEYLRSLPKGELQRLWLDVKNLSKEACKPALARLEYLHARYRLKDRAIVESASAAACFRQLRRSGWNTSYYLPTDAVLALLRKKDTEGQALLATKIAARAQAQRTSSVSFDRRLYPFVKTHLEPLLRAEIEYHLWDTSTYFYSHDLLEQLRPRPYFQDRRIKTIILPQHSLAEQLMLKAAGVRKRLFRK